MSSQAPHPFPKVELDTTQIGTTDEWRTARLNLLAKEQEYHRLYETILAERQALPFVPVTKDYTFQSIDGPVSLKDLFGTKSQLIIYHHMFEPTADEGCHGCSFIVANFPDLRHLADKDTAAAVVSIAPIEKIAPYKEKNFPAIPWVSSASTSFSYDFHAAFDERSDHLPSEFQAAGGTNPTGSDVPAFLVFKLQGGQVYHTYSNLSRIDNLAATHLWLDMTPAGRQDEPNGPAFKTPSEYAQEGRVSGRI
ncbi:hypothetical protein EDB81DRAFT_797949 [Dactylonectria macrodidyma]|uniref:DUF899-domain-containing protein n=1 Tax=Dactylonectria macrodidyma TaxID=307937 RepID=A0A9P9ES56_9HYPO|nr:hypothetical protein EDB81DRAFT_797949 [Dactylonectria macrodidyma]